MEKEKQEEKPKVKLGLMQQIQIMKMFRGLYANLCDACKKDIVTLTHKHSRGGNVDTETVVERAKEVSCNKCKEMVADQTRVMLEVVKHEKEKND